MTQSNGVRQNNGLNIWRASENRRGQVMVFMALTMPLIFGMTAIVFDFGMVYINQNRLNGSSQAAALAGAEAMAQAGATTASVTAAATLYSGVSGDDNANSGLTGVSMVSGYPTLSCLSTLQSSFGINCYGPSSTNAIQVKQQVSAPLYFLGLFGFNSVNLTATATASMKGANVSPFNIAIILDTTQSMNSTDSDSTCSNTRISCALAGVQVSLKNLSPCLVSESSCGAITSGNVSNSVDRVSLMAFPAVTTLTTIDDLNCGSTLPTTAPYAAPFPLTSTYQIVNFSSDYLVPTKFNAEHRLEPGYRGGGTARDAVNGKRRIWHLLCTGDQIGAGISGHGAGTVSGFEERDDIAQQQSATATCSTFLLGVCLTGDMPGASTTSGTYMSTLPGVSSGGCCCCCGGGGGNAGVFGCVRRDIVRVRDRHEPDDHALPDDAADSMVSGYFFSDYTATGGSSSCVSAAQPVTSLSQIFQVIAGDFTVARLIPNNTN